MILHQLPVPTKENNDEVAIIVVTVAGFTYFVCQLWLSLTDETVASISKPRLLNSFFVFVVIAVMLVGWFGSVLYCCLFCSFANFMKNWKVFLYISLYLFMTRFIFFFCNAIFLFIYLTFSFLDTLWFYTNWLYECILWAWATSKYLQSIDFMDQH